MSALHIACYQGHTDVVEALLKIPRINVNCKDQVGADDYSILLCSLSLAQIGYTALFWACHQSHTSIVQLLVAEKNIEVNSDKVR